MGDFVNRRHHGFGTGVSMTGNKDGKIASFVPKGQQVTKSVAKYEALKNSASGGEVELNSQEVRDIKKIHPVGKEGKLGNTGISLLPSSTKPGIFILKK